jgi:hypothetical protein
VFLGSSTHLMCKKRRVCPYANLLFALQGGKVAGVPTASHRSRGEPRRQVPFGRLQVVGRGQGRSH